MLNFHTSLDAVTLYQPQVKPNYVATCLVTKVLYIRTETIGFSLVKVRLCAHRSQFLVISELARWRWILPPSITRSGGHRTKSPLDTRDWLSLLTSTLFLLLSTSTDYQTYLLVETSAQNWLKAQLKWVCLFSRCSAAQNLRLTPLIISRQILNFVECVILKYV